MALLHSFWAAEAAKTFASVQAQDFGCAIALWGVAMALQQNPLTGQEPPQKAIEEARAALDRAKAIGAKTPREREYIEAIDLIYREAGKTDFSTRRVADETAMAALAQRYPDDSEAQIFHALALDMTAPLTDKTYAHQLAAAAILERVQQQQPDHPGVVHYIVHSYDYPDLAGRGLDAARRYAEIAPAQPHAQHMPSHVFTRLGMWRESVESNLRSAAAAKAEGNGQEQAHAVDYLVLAYLQLGLSAEAKRVVDESATLTVNPTVFIGPFALAAMPARYALERRAWNEAIQLTARPSRFPFTEATTFFARGLGFANTGDLASARREETKLAEARDGMAAQNNTYWSRQVEVQRLAVAAWAALADGETEKALSAMQASADLEDTMEKHIVTPSPIVPARELLGEMLLRVGQPADASVAFESSGKREPNRLRGLYDAARGASGVGNLDKATDYYRRLATLADAGDPPRPELVEARAHLQR